MELIKGSRILNHKYKTPYTLSRSQVVEIISSIKDGWSWQMACARANIPMPRRTEVARTHPLLRRAYCIAISRNKTKQCVIRRFKYDCEQLDRARANV